MMERTRGQKLGSANPLKQRETGAGTLACGMESPQFSMDLSSSVTLFWKQSLRRTQRYISYVILSPVNLTMKINHYTNSKTLRPSLVTSTTYLVCVNPS